MMICFARLVGRVRDPRSRTQQEVVQIALELRRATDVVFDWRAVLDGRYRRIVTVGLVVQIVLYKHRLK